MKHFLLTTIAAVLVVGCGESQLPKLPAFKASDILIHTAAEAGNIEAVKQHLAEGADVNAKGLKGETPLHGAASRGLKEIIELLIAEGADVNAEVASGSQQGFTPLDYATHPDNPNASTETADLLRKHGGKTGEELKAEGK
jgi:ankyrin repeat protein